VISQEKKERPSSGDGEGDEGLGSLWRGRGEAR